MPQFPNADFLNKLLVSIMWPTIMHRSNFIVRKIDAQEIVRAHSDAHGGKHSGGWVKRFSVLHAAGTQCIQMTLHQMDIEPYLRFESSLWADKCNAWFKIYNLWSNLQYSKREPSFGNMLIESTTRWRANRWRTDLVKRVFTHISQLAFQPWFP